MSEKIAGLASLDERSRQVFEHLVDTYISSGDPVGSRTLSRALPLSLSPASIRNVMADLEEAGLLFSPHTSAGRIPTELGLRFFVDALMDKGPLDTGAQRMIEDEVGDVGRDKSVEDVLSAASSALSGLSHCAGVVLSPKADMRLRHIEFVKLSNETALVVMVGEDGNVENRAIDIPPGLPASTLIRASNFLNARVQGKTVVEIQRFITTEVDQLERELDDLSARIVAAGFAEWGGSERGNDDKTLIVRGQANLLDSASALDDLERIRHLFNDLEEKKELIQLLGLAESGEGVRIFIGSENKLFSLSGSSLILSPYQDKRQQVVGVLGVIGPTRLNYARIIPLVEYTARTISRMLS